MCIRRVNNQAVAADGGSGNMLTVCAVSLLQSGYMRRETSLMASGPGDGGRGVWHSQLCDLVKCQSRQTPSLPHMHPKSLTNASDTSEKVSHRMPFCLMTHAASSLRPLSNGAQAREHLLFPTVSHYQGSESPTAPLDTYFNNNQRKCVGEYFVPRMTGRLTNEQSR